MGLSLFLERGVIRPVVGGILSNLSLKQRRTTLIFEDILANYAKVCEEEGYSKEVEEIGRRWGAVMIKQLMPDAIKKHQQMAINAVMGGIWKNYGLLDDVRLNEKDGFLSFYVKNDCITRTIGQNKLVLGAYKGALESLYNFRLETVKSVQNKKRSDYEFKITHEPFDINGKDRATYIRLNKIPEGHIGLDLKSALKSKIFRLKDNKIYFRDRILPQFDYTLIHLIANRGILLDKVANISYDYFKEVGIEDTSDEEKLALMKNLLQAMGWGIIQIRFDPDKISLNIKHPPYGLQTEKDDWGFLIQIILGYLWTLDESFKITDIKVDYKDLYVTFSKVT